MKTAKNTAKSNVKAIAKKSDNTVTANVSSKQIDPLYIIFEQHLFNFSDENSDRNTFITGVVQDYITYLRKSNVVVPKSLEASIMDEIGTQVNTMLVKKIYGCSSINDYTSAIPAAEKKQAKTRYKKVAKATKA